MPSQNITEPTTLQDRSQEQKAQGMIVPLDLPAFRILRQEVQADGTIEVEVIGKNERAACPHCQRICVKVHDTRLRRKRDVPLREHRVVLVLHKRRGLRALAVDVASPNRIVPVAGIDAPRCDCVKRSASRRAVSPSPMSQPPSRWAHASCKPVWRLLPSRDWPHGDGSRAGTGQLTDAALSRH